MDQFELAAFHRAIEEYFEDVVYHDIVSPETTPKNFRFTYKGQTWVIGIKGLDEGVCDTCLGYGVLERKDGSEVECPDCDGTIYQEPDLRDIVTLEEHQASEIQKFLLQKRYGTTRPKSIADYWQKQA